MNTESPVVVTAVELETHTRFKLTGEWCVQPILELARGMAETITGTAHKRALIDLMDLQGSLSVEERYRIGSSLGPIFGGARKVAVVQVIREQNGYIAKIANRSGAKMQVFSHEDDALFWLLH